MSIPTIINNNEISSYGHKFVAIDYLKPVLSVSDNKQYKMLISILDALDARLSDFNEKYPLNDADTRVCNRLSNQMKKKLLAIRLKYLEAAVNLDWYTLEKYTFLILKEICQLVDEYDEKFGDAFSFHKLSLCHTNYVMAPVYYEYHNLYTDEERTRFEKMFDMHLLH